MVKFNNFAKAIQLENLHTYIQSHLKNPHCNHSAIIQLGPSFCFNLSEPWEAQEFCQFYSEYIYVCGGGAGGQGRGGFLHEISFAISKTE